MNKIHLMIGVIITAILIGVFLPVIDDGIGVVETPTYIETDTAVEVLATPEVVALDNTPVVINYVTVEGVELIVDTEYTFSGGVLTILANNSDTGDTIITSYTYTDTGATNVVTLLNIVPLIFVTVFITYLVFKFKSRD